MGSLPSPIKERLIGLREESGLHRAIDRGVRASRDATYRSHSHEVMLEMDLSRSSSTSQTKS